MWQYSMSLPVECMASVFSPPFVCAWNGATLSYTQSQIAMGYRTRKLHLRVVMLHCAPEERGDANRRSPWTRERVCIHSRPLASASLYISVFGLCLIDHHTWFHTNQNTMIRCPGQSCGLFQIFAPLQWLFQLWYLWHNLRSLMDEWAEQFK